MKKVYRDYQKELDIHCTYKLNKYLNEQNVANYDFVIMKLNDFETIKYKKFNDKKLKDVVSDDDFLRLLKKLKEDDLSIKLEIENNKIKKRYYCSYSQDIQFRDEDYNIVSFNNLQENSICSIKVIKIFKNESKYPTLNQYLEEFKGNDIMKCFEHHITVEDGCVYIFYFGKEISEGNSACEDYRNNLDGKIIHLELFAKN